MKQTNNAIKFLMAQYRAIFKNANIAMLAAMAASALAAGQVQAAGTNIENWKDVATGDYNGGTETADKTLQVVVSNTAENNKNTGDFSVNISAGNTHTIKGSTDGHALTGADGANTSITLAGDKADPSTTKLEIGAAGDAYVGVTVKSFNNYGGTLSVVGGSQASSLTATNIVIGGSAPAAGDAPATVADANPYAIVSLGAKGQIIGAESGSFLVKTGGELQFAGADSVADAKSGLTIDGGAVSVSGAASGTIKGAITMNSGKLTVSGGATATSLKVTGSATINDGALKVASGGTAGGSLTFEKGVTFNSGSLTIEDGTNAATSGKLVVSGDAVFNKGSTFTLGGSGAATFNGNVKFAAGTLASTGTIDLGTVGGDTAQAVRNAKLEVAAADFEKLFKGDAKVKVAGHTASGGELTIAVTGEEKIDLVKSGLFASSSGKIDLTGGLAVEAAQKTKVAVTITGQKADFSADLIDDSEIGKVGLSFNELAVGNTEAAFTLKGANNAVTVSKSLSHAKVAAQDIKVVSGGTLNLFTDASGSVTAKSITLAVDGGDVGGNLNVKGKWELPSLTITKGSANLTDATVTLKQDAVLTTTQTNGVLTLNSSSLDATKGKLQLGESAAKLEAGSKFTATGAQLYTISGTGDSATVTPTNAADGNKAPKNAFTSTDGSGILEIKDAAAGTVDAALAKKIKDALGYTGFVEFAGNTKVEAYDQPTADFSTTDMSVVGMYDNTQAVMDKNNTIDKGVAAGSIKLHSGTDVGVVSKGVILSNAGNTGNGMFVQTSAGNPGSVQLSGTSSSITLNGNGKIGAIDAAADGNGSIMIGSQAKNVASNVEVIGAIGGTQPVGKLVVDGKASLTINAKAGQGSIKAQNLTLADGSKLVAVGQDITVSTAAKLDGDVTAKSMTLNGTGVHTVAGDALVDLEKISVAGTLAVGNDDPTISGSATLISDQMNVTGTLFVDPDWQQKRATVIVNNLDGSTGETHAGTLNGSAIVGKNAVLAVGFDKSETAKVDALIGQYLNAKGAFSSGSGANDVGNALILNKSINLAADKAIIVDKTASINLTDGTTSPDVATNKNSVILGANSALVVTDKAFAKDSTGAKTGAAITLNGNAQKFKGEGGKIILSGNFTAADNALKIVSGSALTVSGTTEVTTLNGLLAGKLTAAGGTVDLNTTDKVKESFLDVATPVRNLLVDSLEGKYATNTGAGVDFVLAAASNTVTGYDVDAAAHAATYAGAQQAAVAAVTTMADAMFGRVGAVGVEAASISATGSQANGGVWLTPMYKSVDSDGFNAEGASYGSDVDLAGVAFGTDTVNGNMRFGAVFNIGSGDAEGKGNGNGLKDEFDYYGFGIYSAMGFGNFALVGDASMTVISHEVEGLGLRGKADTTAVTMGVTGQYTIATPAVDVTPQLGARFIRLNTDSYDLFSADGVLATTDFDVQNVFSVPLGVSLSKGFVTGGWTLAPSADITVAFNTGDTEAKSTTTFDGLPSIGLNTEVLDEVQYGVTLGLGAQYGAFGTSFGINYTGSSNTDSFGVNAQARYMF